MSKEKRGVVVVEIEPQKTASVGLNCPKCGDKVEESWCPSCGTKPFEIRKDEDDGQGKED